MLFKRIKNIIRSNINYKEEESFNPDINLNDVEDLYFEDSQDEVKDNTESKYYANLELEYGANFTEIKKAYRKLLKKYHPDLYPVNSEKHKIAVKITKQLNEAYNYFERKYL